jgi:hypothetical protein
MMIMNERNRRNDNVEPRADDAVDQRQPREQEQTDFYEAMPATMNGARVRNDADDRVDDNANERRSILPWLLIPALILLGWALWNAVSNSNQNNGNTGTGTNSTQNQGTTGSGTGTGNTGSTNF